VLSHTFTGPDTLWDVRLNGEPASEARFNAAVAGQYGVPVGLITGDDVIVPGVKRFSERTITYTGPDRGRSARTRIEARVGRTVYGGYDYDPPNTGMRCAACSHGIGPGSRDRLKKGRDGGGTTAAAAFQQ
jgi:D-aminopeptidase